MLAFWRKLDNRKSNFSVQMVRCVCNLFWSVNFYFILKNKWLRKKLADPGSGLREALDSTERNRSVCLH